MFVLAVIVVLTIVRHLFAYLYRTDHVQLQVVLSPTLVVEILMHRTRSTVVGVVLTHRPFRHLCIRSVEVQVRETYQNNGSTRSKKTVCSGFCLCTTYFCAVTFRFRAHTEGFLLYRDRKQSLFVQPITLLIGDVVIALVSLYEDCFLGTVSCRANNTATTSWYSHDCHCHPGNEQSCKNLFHVIVLLFF